MYPINPYQILSAFLEITKIYKKRLKNPVSPPNSGWRYVFWTRIRVKFYRFTLPPRGDVVICGPLSFSCSRDTMIWPMPRYVKPKPANATINEAGGATFTIKGPAKPHLVINKLHFTWQPLCYGSLWITNHETNPWVQVTTRYDDLDDFCVISCRDSEISYKLVVGQWYSPAMNQPLNRSVSVLEASFKQSLYVTCIYIYSLKMISKKNIKRQSKIVQFKSWNISKIQTPWISFQQICLENLRIQGARWRWCHSPSLLHNQHAKRKVHLLPCSCQWLPPLTQIDENTAVLLLFSKRTFW